ncbi:hypothetical protein MUG94_14720 [Arthrobacter gengyunqii]|uniref:Uncharacterized protein n=1 Tax=Arthrobacter gengyunqii TaxID=2886940 RepID=A0A9X1LZX8_9MICC|nr:hypothetical protein [Arthrobacter gengyunqii]MCC3268370.1 hypothetical protein [Arthrobacter gengyunqii]UOY95766.1 hypothetical protein MUG94_14720 [Arthrobacter gengyunqii]
MGEAEEDEGTVGAGLLVLPAAVLSAGAAEQDARTTTPEHANKVRRARFPAEILEMSVEAFQSVFSIVEPNHIRCAQIKDFE